ncbi:MAG: NUDIX hydrolase [Candidatus Levybacteria bacterium]|nr:NUDIX hydrolase [Candidatus Levybacteria bacterium]
MSQWKAISQKYAFRSSLFNVREVLFKNERGTKKIHYTAERRTTVSIFPLTDKYEIYLISQYRYMLGKTVLEAVSGYVKSKETTIKAAERELKEEAGISAHQLEEIGRIEMAGSVFKSRVYLFLAKGLEMGSNDLDEDEEISVVKMPLNAAAEKVMAGEINHASSAIGILMLDKLRKEKKL